MPQVGWYISSNSFRTDRTHFESLEEAIEKGWECARILGRAISVYKIVDSQTEHVGKVQPNGEFAEGPNEMCNPSMDEHPHHAGEKFRPESIVTIGSAERSDHDAGMDLFTAIEYVDRAAQTASEAYHAKKKPKDIAKNLIDDLQYVIDDHAKHISEGRDPWDVNASTETIPEARRRRLVKASLKRGLAELRAKGDLDGANAVAELVEAFGHDDAELPIPGGLVRFQQMLDTVLASKPRVPATWAQKGGQMGVEVRSLLQNVQIRYRELLKANDQESANRLQTLMWMMREVMGRLSEAAGAGVQSGGGASK